MTTRGTAFACGSNDGSGSMVAGYHIDNVTLSAMWDARKHLVVHQGVNHQGVECLVSHVPCTFLFLPFVLRTHSVVGVAGCNCVWATS